MTLARSLTGPLVSGLQCELTCRCVPQWPAGMVQPLPPALDSFPPRAYASVRPELRAGHPGHGGVVAIAWLKVLI